MSAGIQNQVGIGKEVSYGTPVAPTFFLPVKESDGIQISNDTKFVESINGTPAKNKDSFKGKVEIGGGYDAYLYPQFLGHILRSALGQVNSALASGETAIYKHTITEVVAKPSYTVEQKVGEIVKRFAGFVVRNFKLEAKVGEDIGLSFEGVGKSQATASASSPSFETTRPFNFADVINVKIGATDMVAQCEELSIEYDNGVEGFYALGDNNIKNVIAKPSTVKGKLTLYMDDTTKATLEDYIANTPRALDVVVAGDSIGVASKNTLRVLIPKAVMTSNSQKLAADYNVMEIEFEGVYDATDGLIKVELTNALTAY